ncbi:hypothetical protein F4677DRAFT_81792 [Hypoxylon crocopeplum]|nr:hypothetical protein F4677DRAFT_81792 [Hypoxylon crocopeplum]
MAPGGKASKWETPAVKQNPRRLPPELSSLSPTSSAPHRRSSEGREPLNQSTSPSQSKIHISSLPRPAYNSPRSGGEGKCDKQRDPLSFSRICQRLKQLALHSMIPVPVSSPPSSSIPTTASSPSTYSPQAPKPGVPGSALEPHPTITSHLIAQPRPRDKPSRIPILQPSLKTTRTSSLVHLNLRRGLQSLQLHNRQPTQALNLTVEPADSHHCGFTSRVAGGSLIRSSYLCGIQKNCKVRFKQDQEMASGKERMGSLSADDGRSKPPESSPDMRHDSSHNAEMVDSPITSTPAHKVASTPSTAGFTPSSRPVTRSMARVNSANPSVTFMAGTSLRERLQRSAKKPIPTLDIPNLESSRDIDYGGVKQDDEVDEDENGVGIAMKDRGEPLISPHLEKPPRKRPSTDRLRVPTRRSTRINDRKLAIEQPVDLTVAAPAKKRARRAGNTKIPLPLSQLRRSPRFLKPLTEFHKYPDLPRELQIMVWEAAIEARLVYICNRTSAASSIVPFGVQNKLPTWFMTCSTSVWVARLHYQKLFALHSRPIPPLNITMIDLTTIQDVSPNNDIVIFEPCHNGCRGYHCARHQYCDTDRSAVRFLAVQTESPSLPPTADPCWETVTRSWPNVETLYLMRVAVKGVDKRDKAMIRVKCNAHETTLLTRFEQWKKELGADAKLTKLDFVVVVEKESTIMGPYQSVADRKTGQPEDIILD